MWRSRKLNWSCFWRKKKTPEVNIKRHRLLSFKEYAGLVSHLKKQRYEIFVICVSAKLTTTRTFNFSLKKPSIYHFSKYCYCICKHTQGIFFGWLFRLSQWEAFKIRHWCLRSHRRVRVVNDLADRCPIPCCQQPRRHRVRIRLYADSQFSNSIKLNL